MIMMKTVLVSFLTAPCVHAIPTGTAFGINRLSIIDSTCAVDDAIQGFVGKYPFVQDTCYVLAVGGQGDLMKKQSLNTAGTGITMNIYPGTDCGTLSTTQEFAASTTCLQSAPVSTNGNTYLSSVPWTPGSTELIYGFYSDSTCDTPDGITAKGFLQNQTGASGSCIANAPIAGYSTEIEYTSSTVGIKVHANSVTCGATTTTDISGDIGSCFKVSAATATALSTFTGAIGANFGFSGFTSCSNVNSCYVFAFPTGALDGSAASTSAASTSVTYMAMALLLSCFVILL
jgi:hypothetical protein